VIIENQLITDPDLTLYPTFINRNSLDMNMSNNGINNDGKKPPRLMPSALNVNTFMKQLLQIIFLWGIFDFAAIVCYMGWNLYMNFIFHYISKIETQLMDGNRP